MNGAPSGHLPRLDGVRGIAILLVLLSHFRMYSRVIPGGVVDVVVLRSWEAGWIGVDLFFVLSGFLITGILLDSRGSETYYRSFYMRRVLRIFPLYYVSLVVLLVVLPLLLPRHELLGDLSGKEPWFWLYLTNVLVARDGWPEMAGHFWSLAVEEQFYLVWPLAVAVVAPRRLKALCVTLIVSAVLIRIWLASQGAHLAAYVLTPARMDTLIAGAFLAVAVRDDRLRPRLQRLAVPGLVAGCGVLAVIFVSQKGFLPETPFASTVGYTATAFWGAGMVNYAVNGSPDSWVSRVFGWGWLQKLGVYSYGLYVVHQPILEFFPEPWTPRYWPWSDVTNLHWLLLFSAGGMAASMAVALLSWHLVELPFLRLKKRFPYGPRAPRARPEEA